MSAAGADRDDALPADAASGTPSGAARRVRLLTSLRGHSIVLPALIGAGVVLGLTFVHFSRDSSGDAVAQESQRATITAPAIATDASGTTESTADADTSEIAQYAASPSMERKVVARRPESDADPADSPTGAPQFPTYDESAVQLAEEHEVPAEISGAVDANARATTLRELGPSPSADSFPLLERTLSSDSIARNRLLAVNSLRLLGKQAGNTERAREALRLAMSDTDENVRTSARDAYQELSR